MHLSATPEENTNVQAPVTSPEIKEDEYEDTTDMEDQEEEVGNCDSDQIEPENDFEESFESENMTEIVLEPKMIKTGESGESII